MSEDYPPSAGSTYETSSKEGEAYDEGYRYCLAMTSPGIDAANKRADEERGKTFFMMERLEWVAHQLGFAWSGDADDVVGKIGKVKAEWDRRVQEEHEAHETTKLVNMRLRLTFDDLKEARVKAKELAKKFYTLSEELKQGQQNAVDRAEQAEADCAAMRKLLVEVYPLVARYPLADAVDTAIQADHPGAALLERHAKEIKALTEGLNTLWYAAGLLYPARDIDNDGPAFCPNCGALEKDDDSGDLDCKPDCEVAAILKEFRPGPGAWQHLNKREARVRRLEELLYNLVTLCENDEEAQDPSTDMWAAIHSAREVLAELDGDSQIICETGPPPHDWPAAPDFEEQEYPDRT